MYVVYQFNSFGTPISVSALCSLSLPPQMLTTISSFDYEWGCVTSDMVVLNNVITRDECRRKCVEYGSACKGSEYFTIAGMNGNCYLSKSNDTSGCNNTALHAEFYTKVGFADVITTAPTPLPIPTS